jgi:hypothetical protein
VIWSTHLLNQKMLLFRTLLSAQHRLMLCRVISI